MGAAICTPGGDVIAVGVNDVPAPGGGHYWPDYDDDGHADAREHAYPFTLPTGEQVIGVDSNDQVKVEIFDDLVRRVFESITAEMLEPDDQMTLFGALKTNPGSVTDALFRSEHVQAAKFFDVIEYSRSVHAEMSALMSCLRNGVSTVGATLYCTTFPCHECSRHIIAAGIAEVVYIEPYSKSRVLTLHADAVEAQRFTGPPNAEPPAPTDAVRVRFRPFIGLAPPVHPRLYSFTTRKIDGPVKDRTYLGRRKHWSLDASSRYRGTVVARTVSARVAEEGSMAFGEQFVELAVANLLSPAAVGHAPEPAGDPSRSSDDPASGAP